MLRGVQDAQVPAQSHRKDAVAQSGYEGGNLGSYPLLTPPAGRWILDSRINKAILKCAVIAVRINLKAILKCAAIAVRINLKTRFKTHQ